MGRYKGKCEIREKEHILTASLVTYLSISIYDPQNTRVMTMATTIRRGTERIRRTTEGSGRCNDISQFVVVYLSNTRNRCLSVEANFKIGNP